MGTFTVFYDGQFFVGLAERTRDGVYEIARVIFGPSEPTDAELVLWAREQFAQLRYHAAPAHTRPATRPLGNPKRRQRAAARALADTSATTKAQAAFAAALAATAAQSPRATPRRRRRCRREPR